MYSACGKYTCGPIVEHYTIESSLNGKAWNIDDAKEICKLRCANEGLTSKFVALGNVESGEEPTCVCLDSNNNKSKTKNTNLNWTSEEAELACPNRCNNNYAVPLKGTYKKNSWYANKIGNYCSCEYDDIAYFNYVNNITSPPATPCPTCNLPKKPKKK